MGVAPEMGKLGARRGVFTSQQCNVVFGVTGELEGQIIFGMTLFAADKIASEMLMAPVLTFNELAASAIAEMGNMISGGALTGLSAVGYKCWLSPPSLI
jgi:chemotaxis protein CheX